jgi:hypothetical protein
MSVFKTMPTISATAFTTNGAASEASEIAQHALNQLLDAGKQLSWSHQSPGNGIKPNAIASSRTTNHDQGRS